MSTKWVCGLTIGKLWIVLLRPREATRLIISKIEKQLGRSGGARSYDPYEITASTGR